MTTAPPVECSECGRPNGPQAKRCIWCGVPFIDGATPGKFEETRVEIDYLGGIERLEEPTTVRLTIGPSGLEVSELMPGSRTIKIEPDCILDATAVDGSTMVPGIRSRPKLWWLLSPIRSWFEAPPPPETKKHDSILTIRYMDGDEIRHAVFHREGRGGLALVNQVARTVSLLLKSNQQRKTN